MQKPANKQQKNSPLHLGTNDTDTETFRCPGCGSPVVNSAYGIKRHLQIANKCTAAMQSIGFNEDGHKMTPRTTEQNLVVARRSIGCITRIQPKGFSFLSER